MNREQAPDHACREGFGRATLARPIEVSEEDEREFRAAMERYKIRSGRQFPTWSEVLEILRAIGYAKRIWKPVGVWSPLPPMPILEGAEGAEPAWPIGWYASAEMLVGP